MFSHAEITHESVDINNNTSNKCSDYGVGGGTSCNNNVNIKQHKKINIKPRKKMTSIANQRYLHDIDIDLNTKKHLPIQTVCTSTYFKVIEINTNLYYTDETIDLHSQILPKTKYCDYLVVKCNKFELSGCKYAFKKLNKDDDVSNGECIMINHNNNNNNKEEQSNQEHKQTTKTKHPYARIHAIINKQQQKKTTNTSINNENTTIKSPQTKNEDKTSANIINNNNNNNNNTSSSINKKTKNYPRLKLLCEKKKNSANSSSTTSTIPATIASILSPTTTATTTTNTQMKKSPSSQINILHKENLRNYLTKTSTVLSNNNTTNKLNRMQQTLSKIENNNEINAVNTSNSSTQLSSDECSCSCSSAAFEPLTSSSNNSKLDTELVDYIKEKSIEWSKYSKQLVDTHCHFDMLFRKINFTETIDDYFNQFQSLYIDNFHFCINIICDPKRYEKKTDLQVQLNVLKHPKVFGSIGCHPHFADSWTESTENHIYSNLTNPKLVAIGECGIDLSRKNKVSLEKQEKVFHAQLNIAYETTLPIVIHCRGAEDMVFEILCQKLDSSHKIHLHCFTGTWELAKKFLEKFPNLCIGVTPLITFGNYNGAYELAKNIPIERILFETDSPYFVPRHKFPTHTIDSSHPAFIFSVVERVSQIRNMTIDELILINRQNVKKIYGI